MNNRKSFSISFKRELTKRNPAMDSEINKAIQELNFQRPLRQTRIRKKKGYGAKTILFLTVLFPFLKKSITAYWSEKNLGQFIFAQKDNFYRFLNHDRYNWRRFIFLLDIKLTSMNGHIPLDMASHTSSKRPNKDTKNIDKGTCGWKRRKVSISKKNDQLIEMIRCASQYGIKASFLLFDSWFAYGPIQKLATYWN